MNASRKQVQAKVNISRSQWKSWATLTLITLYVHIQCSQIYTYKNLYAYKMAPFVKASPERWHIYHAYHYSKPSQVFHHFLSYVKNENK